jgi:hypothetical protein
MKSTLVSRLKRLEAVRHKQVDTGREAFVVLGDYEGERHLEMTSSDAGRCWFQEKPGRGPQISDFGQFAFVLHLTQAEADA